MSDNAVPSPMNALKKLLPMIGITYLLVSLPFIWMSLHQRWVRERDDKTVELCVDGPEWEALAVGGEDTSSALAELKETGATSVGVYWNGDDPILAKSAQWEIYRRAGFQLTLRPDPAPFTPVRLSALSALTPKAGVSHILFAGPAVWGAPDVSGILEQMSELPWSMPWVEFARQAGLSTVARRFPEKVIRAHSVDDDEMARLSPDVLVSRYRRAVRERGIRFLYLRFFPGLDLDGNMAYLKNLRDGLKADGFQLGETHPTFKATLDWVRMRQIFAFLAAVLLPIIGFRWITLRGDNVPLSVLGTTLFSLIGALLVAGLVSTPVLEMGFEQFRGVKAALVVPLLIAFFHLYSLAEVREWMKAPLTFGSSFLLLGLAAVAAVYVLRSGHGTVVDAGGAELKFREGLEQFFGVRPRFKEFAIGHPMLWLGVYLRRRFPEKRNLFRPLLLLGLIGQISIINTFCHAHIPLDISLLRVWHGIWLGASIGGLLILVAQRIPILGAALTPVVKEPTEPEVSSPRPLPRRRAAVLAQNGPKIKRARVTTKKKL